MGLREAPLAQQIAHKIDEAIHLRAASHGERAPASFAPRTYPAFEPEFRGWTRSANAALEAASQVQDLSVIWRLLNRLTSMVVLLNSEEVSLRLV